MDHSKTALMLENQTDIKHFSFVVQLIGRLVFQSNLVIERVFIPSSKFQIVCIGLLKYFMVMFSQMNLTEAKL